MPDIQTLQIDGAKIVSGFALLKSEYELVQDVTSL